MANLALEVISAAAGTLIAGPFLPQLIGPNVKDATNVRIILGSSTETAQSFGGNKPGVSLWDFNGDAIGFTPGTNDRLPQGNFVDVTVNPRKEIGNIQATYLSVTSGNIDAVCIAGIAVTFPDGAKAGFSGSAAAGCEGVFWSNSRTPILEKQDSGENENPKCFWIDTDGTNGIPHQGVGVHLPSFSNTNANQGEAYTKNRDLMCKSGPRFRMYPNLKTEDSILVFPRPPEFITRSDNPKLIGTDADKNFIIENPGRLAAPLVTPTPCPLIRGCSRRRDQHQRPRNLSNKPKKTTQTVPRRPLAERLIISPHDYNSARELCESDYSYGQSFVSVHEKLFCDMTDKSLYYICSDKVKTCCLDTENESFRACQKGSKRPPIDRNSKAPAAIRARLAGADLDPSWTKSHKVYEHVQRW